MATKNNWYNSKKETLNVMFAQHVTIEVLMKNYWTMTWLTLLLPSYWFQWRWQKTTIVGSISCIQLNIITSGKKLGKIERDLTTFLYGNLPQRAIGSCKVLVGVLGFTVYASVISTGAESEISSWKGTSNNKDWYKQTSSSLQ